MDPGKDRPDSQKSAGVDLFVVGFVILVLELALIRWLPAYVPFLTFFPNFVLIAAFVGMSVGCMAASRERDWLAVSSWLLLATGVGALIVYVASVESGQFQMRVGDPKSPSRIYFGALQDPEEATGLVVPVQLAVGACFALVAAVFLGLGQCLGRALNRVPSRLWAYTLNVAGSLAGVAAMAASSRASLAPVWWFGMAVGGWLWLARARRWHWAAARCAPLVLLLVVVGFAGSRAELLRRFTPGAQIHWSPYYCIKYYPGREHILVNNIGHQTMCHQARYGVAYSLPYWLLRDAGYAAVGDVLIVGAGSGNDSAHALWHGATRIDAVEIDPAIARLGRQYHPNRPYDDPRVHLTIDDGRHFLERSTRQYDLIVYALVDSLTLQSCYSSMRLESYLFTTEAFEAARERLKPGGVIAIYNNFREGWLVAKLSRTLHNVFGQEPLIICLPSRRELTDSERSPNMTLLIAGNTERLRHAFAQSEQFISNLSNQNLNRDRNGFALNHPANSQDETFYPATIVTSRSWVPESDDHPFLYLKDRVVPAHNLWGLAIVVVVSLALLRAFSPGRRIVLDPHFALLGAGFMLIETQSITRMGLLFGATWVVNTIVFSAVLVMIMFSNLYVALAKPRRLAAYYLALVVSLGLNVVVNLDGLLWLSPTWRVLGSCVLLFLPIFFAGIIFATSFSRSRTPDVHFGANVAGAVVGGALEYLSLMIGFKLLVVVAIVIYLLSFGSLRWWPARSA